jgi:NAD(P)H-hydrate epimerase
MAGAVYLAAMAAYRAGAGLVEILTHTKNRTILQQLVPEAVLSCYADKSQLKKAIKISVGKADAIVLGCGAGRSKLSSLAVKYVLNNAKVPCVVDADALNVIANKQGLLKGVSKKQKPQVIITPHPVEAARLLDKKASADRVLANVVLAAEQLCDKYKVNVLLKDARTLILSHDKNTRYINLSGSTALAGAGSGDILAGYIGGLCAAETNTQPVATTAALAAYLHGKAGERAEETVGARAAMARDILQELKK